MKVNEIFYSIEGEGIRAGYPCVFVRLQGCNLNCSYCDTRYACEDQECVDLQIREILNNVREYGCKRVTITGGEPTIHTDLYELASELYKDGYLVNIETNGTKSASEIRDNVPYGVLITMDHKCPSSGMSGKMCIENYMGLERDDVLKFVVGSRADLIDADRIMASLKLHDIHPIYYLSPVFGKIEPKDIVEFMKEHHYNDVRIQLQMHKFIWPPEMKGV